MHAWPWNIIKILAIALCNTRRNIWTRVKKIGLLGQLAPVSPMSSLHLMVFALTIKSVFHMNWVLDCLWIWDRWHKMVNMSNSNLPKLREAINFRVVALNSPEENRIRISGIDKPWWVSNNGRWIPWTVDLLQKHWI